MRVRQLVTAELARRRARNPRYSVRGFARALGVHHATVSRLLRSGRPLSARAVERLGARLDLPPDRIAQLTDAEHQAAIIASVRRPDFRPSTRWIATVTSLPIDAVNGTVQALLRSGRLRMPARDRWIVEARA